MEIDLKLVIKEVDRLTELKEELLQVDYRDTGWLAFIDGLINSLDDILAGTYEKVTT